MDYRESKLYIKEKEKLGSIPGLVNINELLSRLGNPQLSIPAVHIAGTNGKGSIMAFVEETLVKAGKTVGRYISPTIYSYRERWRRNKRWASESDIALAMTEVSKEVEAMVADGMNSPTAFEIETAVAFWLFRYWKCDIMLIECGMGGRLDATNVLGDDALNVMASVSLDHMNVLGNTLIEITREKLGIVKDGSVLVTYPQCSEVMAEITDYCNKHNVTLVKADPDQLVIEEESFRDAEFKYRGQDYKLSLGGEYQIYNAITALEVLEVMAGDEYWKVDYKSDDKVDYKIDQQQDDKLDHNLIYDGLLATRWDGRFTVACTDPLIIVDGAHNEDAWLRLRESLDKYFTNERIIYIMGVFADKEYHKMIRILAPTMKKCYTVESDNPRALSSEALASKLREAGVEAEGIGDVRRAIDIVRNNSENDSTPVVVCGTLSITGAALKYLK